MDKTRDPLDTVMAMQAATMRALADAMALDLAVAPLLVVRRPGCGASTTLRALANALDMRHAEVRCAQIHPSDVSSMPVLVDGAVETRQYEPAFLVRTLAEGRPSLVVLDEADHAHPDVVTAHVEAVVRHARAPVILAFLGTDQEDAMLRTIAGTLGIHRALVPTVRLGCDETGGLPGQPVLAVGRMSLEGSRIGERHLSIETDEPYEHVVRFTVHGRGDQDDDAINEALHAAFDADAAVRLERTPYGLSCTTDDVCALA